MKATLRRFVGAGEERWHGGRASRQHRRARRGIASSTSIYYSKGATALKLVSSQVFDVRDANGVMPSDHRPVARRSSPSSNLSLAGIQDRSVVLTGTRAAS